MQYIVNAKLVLEHGIVWDGVLGIEDGRIALCGPARSCEIPRQAERIDAQGLYVGPGFVDIHVHGRSAYFYDAPEKETAFFLGHGETTILAALYYNLPKDQFLPVIRRIQAFMRSKQTCALAGFYMEGPYMNPTYGACPEQNHWRGSIQKEDYLPIVDAAGPDAKGMGRSTGTAGYRAVCAVREGSQSECHDQRWPQRGYAGADPAAEAIRSADADTLHECNRRSFKVAWNKGLRAG